MKSSKLLPFQNETAPELIFQKYKTARDRLAIAMTAFSMTWRNIAGLIWFSGIMLLGTCVALPLGIDVAQWVGTSIAIVTYFFIDDAIRRSEQIETDYLKR